MIGDTINIQQTHRDKAALILPKIMKKYKRLSVIALGGESGTGKTEVAYVLQQRLYEEYNIRVKLIHIDDYYFTYWNERNDIRKKNGIDSVGQNEIDWKKIKNIITSFKKRKQYNKVQRIHRWTDQIEQVTIDNSKIDLFIVEGLYALYLKEFADFKVYLSGTSKDTEEFRVERGKEKQTTFRKKILQKEGMVVRASKKDANLKIAFKVKETYVTKP